MREHAISDVGQKSAGMQKVSAVCVFTRPSHKYNIFYIFYRLPGTIYFFAGDPSGPDGPKQLVGWKIHFFQQSGS